MIIDLRGQTIQGVSITAMPGDQLMNGKLMDSTITLVGAKAILDDILVGVSLVNVRCERKLYGVEDVLALADGSASMVEIAAKLRLTHGRVQSIIKSSKPEYYRLRQLFKLKAKLPDDLAIAETAKLYSIADACAVHNLSVSTYKARVRRYKEYGLWPQRSE